MGKVLSVNISREKGTEKYSVARAEVVEGWGLEGDAHGGDWDRQVSIFPVESLEKVPPEKKEEVLNGGYTENFTISGINPSLMAVGSLARIGEAVIKILHIGKEELKDHGRPYIVSREGRFGRVLRGGQVKPGDEIKVYNFDTDTFLQCVQDGDSIMTRAFLNGEMSPAARDISGATALILAAWKGHDTVVRVLLDSGSGVNDRSDDGVTALMAAAYTGHTGIVQMLLSAGADHGLQSESGLTALSLARAGNHGDIVRILENCR